MNTTRRRLAVQALCGALAVLAAPAQAFAQLAAPTGLTATATPAEVTLSWSAVSGATRYRVFRATGTSGAYTRIATVRRTSHVDGEVTPGATYSYTVAAWSRSGEGPRSAPVTVTVPTGTDPGPTPPPGPTTGLCGGLVQDKLAHPMTPIARPAPGQAITDPEFGTTIRRISDSGTARCNVVPMYSTVQAWNADESYLILYHAACTTGGAGGHHLYRGKAPYTYLKPLNIRPADLEQVYWDSVDPRILYYANATDRRLYAFNVDTGAATALRDFSTAPTSCTSGLSAGGDAMWTSWNRVIGLSCGSKQFAYDLGTNTVGTVASVATGGYAPQAAPSGRLFFLNVNDSSAQVRDFNMSFLRTLSGVAPGEHSTLGTSDGGDTWYSVQFDGSFVGAAVASDLDTGAARVIVGPATGWPYPPSGVHLSAVAYRNPGWLSVTIMGSPTGQSVLHSEILLVNGNTTGDGAGQVCRVGHHRSNESDNSYWPEPHGTISPSGTRVLFGSNWGTLGTANVDSYVVELPAYRP